MPSEKASISGVRSHGSGKRSVIDSDSSSVAVALNRGDVGVAAVAKNLSRGICRRRWIEQGQRQLQALVKHLREEVIPHPGFCAGFSSLLESVVSVHDCAPESYENSLSNFVLVGVSHRF